MVNVFKAIAHLKKVGFKEFKREAKFAQEGIAQNPLTALRMQSQGYVGVILFSLVTLVIFAINGYWTISGIFFFNSLIMSGQLLNVRNQIKMFKEIDSL